MDSRFDGYLAELADTDPHDGHASDRELQVAVCLSHGMDYEHAANELHISSHTVHNHVSSMLQKFKAKNATQLVAILFRRHLIQ